LEVARRRKDLGKGVYKSCICLSLRLAKWKIRNNEQRRRNEPNVELLNEIGRHLIHGNEVLEVAGNTIDSLIHQHNLFYDENKAAEAAAAIENKSHHIIYTTVQEKLFISKQDIKAINARAVTLYERLRHEINLVRILFSERAVTVWFQF
jgi:hypothetical protein